MASNSSITANSFWGDKPHLHKVYELVKIAELLRSPDGTGGMLSPEYYPPCVSIRSWNDLTAVVKSIRDRMTAKRIELAAIGSEQGEKGVELGAKSVSSQLMQQVLNRYIPLLHDVLEHESIPPAQVYTLLRQIVGELSMFSETVSVLGATNGADGLPPYQHERLWHCFDQAAQCISFILRKMTPEPMPMTEVVFHYDRVKFFATDLEPEFFVPHSRIFLAIDDERPAGELFGLLQLTGKIASREEMPAILRGALPGLRLMPLDAHSEELRMRARYRYFEVDQSCPHWRRIQHDQNILVYCKELSPETDIRLLCITSEERRDVCP